MLHFKETEDGQGFYLTEMASCVCHCICFKHHASGVNGYRNSMKFCDFKSSVLIVAIEEIALPQTY